VRTSKHERDAEINRLHKRGVGVSEIGRRLGVSRGRVQQIVLRDEFRANHRAALIAKYGKHPDIFRLPDDTPLEAVTLCDGKVQAWETRVMHLATADPPIRTLGDLRQASDTQLLAVNNVGKKLIVELRRFCPAAGTPSLKKSRKSLNDASAALKMIRRVVEAHAPPGTVPDGNVGRGFVKEAEALIEGILAIVTSKGHDLA
jgi:DNA-binding CsgD family transcriptional regulator